MSDASVPIEILSPRSEVTVPARRDASSLKFEERMANPFILKSLSAETRESYRRGIQKFFRHAGWPHPTQVTPEHVLRYRDRLVRDKRRPATVAQKLSVVRSFFSYLQAAGEVTLNPASAKLVPPPPVPAQQAGRALTPKEVRHLLASPDKTKPEGARDYAMLLVMLRLSLRLLEVCSLRRSSITATQGRWVLKCKIKGGREEVWPLPADVKEAIDDYLRLDYKRRRTLHSDGPDAHSFSRTRITERSSSTRP